MAAAPPAGRPRAGAHVRPQLGLLVLHHATGKGFEEGVALDCGAHKLLHGSTGVCGKGSQQRCAASRVSSGAGHRCHRAGRAGWSWAACCAAVNARPAAAVHSRPPPHPEGQTCVRIDGQCLHNRLCHFYRMLINKACCIMGAASGGRDLTQSFLVAVAACSSLMRCPRCQ